MLREWLKANGLVHGCEPKASYRGFSVEVLTAGGKMLAIMYALLIVYSLPIFFIVGAIVTTEWFTLANSTPYIANAISDEYVSFFRGTFGSIVIPLMTAYSVHKPTANTKVPKDTLQIFFFLLGLFILATSLYPLVKYHEKGLSRFNEMQDGKVLLDVPKVFLDTLSSYGKESLTYIALLLGISLKK